MPQNKPHTSILTGFTLVELLVVIAVIGVGALVLVSCIVGAISAYQSSKASKEPLVHEVRATRERSSQ